MLKIRMALLAGALSMLPLVPQAAENVQPLPLTQQEEYELLGCPYDNQRCIELRKRKAEYQQAAKQQAASLADKTASADMVAAVKYLFGNEAVVLNAKQCIIRYDTDTRLDLGKLDPRKAKIDTRVERFDPAGRSAAVAYLIVPGQNENGLHKVVIGDRQRYLDAFLFLYKQGCPSTKLAF